MWRELIHEPPARRIEPVIATRASSRSLDDLVVATQQTLEGDVLRYSQRMKLLQVAKAAGIDRFDANLIIAAEQNRAATDRQSSEQKLAIATPQPTRTPVGWVIGLVMVEVIAIALLMAI